MLPLAQAAESKMSFFFTLNKFHTYEVCYRIPDDNSYRKPNLTTERQGFCRKAHGEKTGIDPHVSQSRGLVYKDSLPDCA